MLADESQVVQGGDDRAPLVVPAQDQVQQVGGGPRVDRRERLVQQDQSRVLQQQAGEQHPLPLAAGKLIRSPAARSPRAPTRQQSRLGARQPHAADGTKKADLAPHAKAQHVQNGNRKGRIDLVLLRKVGGLAAVR